MRHHPGTAGQELTRFDAGMTVNFAKEVWIQLCAYAGFPRNLNALGVLMKVVRKMVDVGAS
ncbi:hypothetical protein [Variovorax sp. LjRoot178]|uniref:hypothetical protein n=1 Tax=Variovorax sp. LjRoot178 TaxID=3342277 RepID=UPI003ECD6B6B